MTELIIDRRGSGKTTMLVKESARTGAIIVAATNEMCGHVKTVARNLGLKIPEPITCFRYIRTLANPGIEKSQKYLIDELQLMLCQMNVEIATVDVESVGALNQ